MDITNLDDLLEIMDSIVDYLVAKEDTFYVALDMAHQLRDEIIQAAPDDTDD